MYLQSISTLISQYNREARDEGARRYDQLTKVCSRPRRPKYERDVCYEAFVKLRLDEQWSRT